MQKRDDEERAEPELNNCTDRLQEYCEALEVFEMLAAKAPAGRDVLEAWRLAARNLINRAAASAILLERVEELEMNEPDAPRREGPRPRDPLRDA